MVNGVDCGEWVSKKDGRPRDDFVDTLEARDANHSNNNKAADHGERIFVDSQHRCLIET
jgi:hypothetical protein